MDKVILHAEDDENDAFLFRYAMDKAGPGASLRVVSDGQMAIDYFRGVGKFQDREAFPLPSLVLLDLKLPEVQGLEVLKWIRSEAGLDVPVVILSSSQNDADISTAYELGANAYLVKPSDTDKLLEMARMIRDFCLRHHTPPLSSIIAGVVSAASGGQYERTPSLLFPKQQARRTADAQYGWPR